MGNGSFRTLSFEKWGGWTFSNPFSSLDVEKVHTKILIHSHAISCWESLLGWRKGLAHPLTYWLRTSFVLFHIYIYVYIYDNEVDGTWAIFYIHLILLKIFDMSIFYSSMTIDFIYRYVEKNHFSMSLFKGFQVPLGGPLTCREVRRAIPCRGHWASIFFQNQGGWQSEVVINNSYYGYAFMGH